MTALVKIGPIIAADRMTVSHFNVISRDTPKLIRIDHGPLKGAFTAAMGCVPAVQNLTAWAIQGCPYGDLPDTCGEVAALWLITRDRVFVFDATSEGKFSPFPTVYSTASSLQDGNAGAAVMAAARAVIAANAVEAERALQYAFAAVARTMHGCSADFDAICMDNLPKIKRLPPVLRGLKA